MDNLISRLSTIKQDVEDKLKASNLKWLNKNTIFLTLAGSVAYGTNHAGSDIDVRGIAIPPKEYFHGYLNTFEQAEFKGEPDMVVFDIRKFIKLAADCNPNIIEFLFTDNKSWLGVEPKLFGPLHDNRNLFLSKKAKHTFSGYAMSQLKRINLHYKWLKNPPSAPPTRAAMGLAERFLLPKEQIAAAQAQLKHKIEEWDIDWQQMDRAERIVMQERLSLMLAELGYTRETAFLQGAGAILGFDTNFIRYLQLEKAFEQEMADWNSYLDWKQNRNPARAALEAKYGYDCKHGMHLVRLMRMGREILESGVVCVNRPDADELKAIRNGAWSYEKLIEWAKNEEESLGDLYRTSIIVPKDPDRKKIDALCASIVEHSFTLLK